MDAFFGATETGMKGVLDGFKAVVETGMKVILGDTSAGESYDKKFFVCIKQYVSAITFTGIGFGSRIPVL